MSKVKPARLLLPLALLLLALAQTAEAQTDARRALSGLPASEAVLYVNAHRIVQEVLPRMMPPAEYAKMLREARQVGFDARGLDYVAVGARLGDTPPPNNLPEFVVVLRGNFNADALLSLGRIAAGAQNITPRTETYGSKTLEIIDLESVGKKEWPTGADGEGGPGSMPYKELAVMALDANTLVAGVPAYVRDLVDASGGRGALKSSMVELAARDPQALWSLTIEAPPNLAEYLHTTGAPVNKEFDEMIGWVKQVSLANSLAALKYTMSASVLTDSPEHASAFSGLVRMGLLAAQTGLSSEAAKLKPRDKNYAQARAALDAIKTFVNRTEGNTLLLSVSFPQKVVDDLVRGELAPRKSPKATTTKPGRRGRTRRR